MMLLSEHLSNDIVSYIAMFVGVAAILAAIFVVNPYRTRGRNLKLHLYITGGATVSMIWHMILGFSIHYWYNYHLLAGVTTAITFVLFFIGIWFSYLHRKEEEAKENQTGSDD